MEQKDQSAKNHENPCRSHAAEQPLQQAMRGTCAATAAARSGQACGSAAAASGSRLDHESSRLDHATCRLDGIPLEKPVDGFEAESSAEETLAAARKEKHRNPAQSDEKINIFQSIRNFAM